MITEYTKETLIGRNIIDLAWKDKYHPREFTFIFYPPEDLAISVRDLIYILRARRITNAQITFSVIDIPTIQIKSIFDLGKWHYFMTTDALENIISNFNLDGIQIVWLEDKDFGIRLDKNLNIIDFWYPEGA